MLAQLFQHRKKYTLTIAFILLIGGIFYFSSNELISSKDHTTQIPTLFVHGFKGGPGSFQTMLERFERRNWGKKDMTIMVSRKGEINIEGTITSDSPLVQVIFKHNRASLWRQTSWLQQIITILQKDYYVEKVNLIGHSMGGLTTTNFVTQQEEDIVEKMVVIGSPFKGIHKEEYFIQNSGPATADLKPNAVSLRQMQQHTIETVKVLAIAGDVYGIKENSDGLVSVSSALGVKDIVVGKNYKERIFYDQRATHSGLHEHPGVDHEIASFLWPS